MYTHYLPPYPRSEKINLTIYPDKREHHVLMDRRWDIRCKPDPPDINDVVPKSVVWTLTCEHVAFCHYNLRSSYLATVTTLFTIQPGVYTATCFMPNFPNVPKTSIIITVHPFVQLRITPTKMYLQPRQKTIYSCYATEDYLEKQYDGVIEMSFVRGEQIAHIKQNTLIQAYTDRYSVGMYCCMLKSRIMEIKRYFVIAVYEIPELVLVNKFVFGTPNNLHQKMWVQPEFFGPLPSRIMCSYNPGQPRILRLKDRVSFEHLYPDMTICSIIQCAYVVGNFHNSIDTSVSALLPLIMVTPYGMLIILLVYFHPEDEQMEFEFYGMKRPGNKLSILLEGNVRCQFRSVYLREMVSANMIKIVRIKGPKFTIRKNYVYVSHGKPGEDFHYKCQFSAGNYTIAEEVNYIFTDAPYIRLVGGEALFPRSYLYCLDEKGGQSYPVNDPSDKRPPVARFRRSGNWIKLGRNMQKSSFYCRHRTLKDFRRYFELRIVDRLYPVIFPATPLRFITGASYVLCLNADPTDEVYTKSILQVDGSKVKSAPIFFMGRGIGSYFEMTSKVGSEGEHTVGCAMGTPESPPITTSTLKMLFATDPISLRFENDTKVMNSSEEKTVMCSYRKLTSKLNFSTEWFILYDSARRLSTNETSLRIAPGDNYGRAIARCGLMYDGDLMSTMDYHVIILPTGTKFNPVIYPERTFLFVDEYVEFYLNVHPVDMPLDIRRRLLAFTTVLLDINGTRTHRLNQLTLQPTNFGKWIPNSWVEFIVSFDMFYSLMQSVLYKKLRILPRPKVHLIPPECFLDKSDFSNWFDIHLISGYDVLHMFNETISWPYDRKQSDGVYVCTVHLGESFTLSSNETLTTPKDATPIVINVSPDVRRLMHRQDFICQVHDWRLDPSIPVEISWRRVQDVSHLFEPRGNMLLGLGHPTRLETIIYECVVSTNGKKARAHTRLVVGQNLIRFEPPDGILHVFSSQTIACILKEGMESNGTLTLRDLYSRTHLLSTNVASSPMRIEPPLKMSVYPFPGDTVISCTFTNKWNQIWQENLTVEIMPVNLTGTINGKDTGDQKVTVGENRTYVCDILNLNGSETTGGIWTAQVFGKDADLVEIQMKNGRASIVPRDPPGFYTSSGQVQVNCVFSTPTGDTIHQFNRTIRITGK
ncbi:hypothetical protein AHF37_03617 [Paragonimus kellicotti]|nr:hypothetical protein AHF37_03617 [Paragonimus kellicotti]